ncbi:vitamin K epoxide reductase family protein [Chitinophagaceae bacterium MMS25-I14]
MSHPSDNELSSLANNWLSLTGNRVSSAYCKDEITTHPDYPALTALTDFLESGGMEYEAVQADASYIREFQYPLLAHIKRPGNEYLHLVTDVTAWEKDKETTKDWSGIALYAAKNAVWHNVENDQRLATAKRDKGVAAAFIIAGIAAFGVSVFAYPHIIVNIFGLLSLAGLAISIAVLGTELGYQSKLVKQVCGMAGNGGCEKVLRSKFAKGIAGITPADASVLYFGAQFFVYLAGCFYTSLLPGIIHLGFAGVAVAGWSIYTQAVKLKEWCALCLCIAGVLLLQSVISFISADLLHISGTYPSYLTFLSCALLLTLSFMPLKQLIKSNSSIKNELAALKKWKTDASLFLTQLEAEPSVDISIGEHELLIGNTNAPVRITVACNPYCGPCARAHETLDHLLAKYPDKLSVQVKLLCSIANGQDMKTIATRAILQKAAEPEGKMNLQQMLTDWFHWMDIEKWQQKWKPEKNTDVTRQLQDHANWTLEADIAYTPTFFINGRRMPGRYQLNDLEKLIPQLAGAFAVQQNG